MGAGSQQPQAEEETVLADDIRYANNTSPTTQDKLFYAIVFASLLGGSSLAFGLQFIGGRG